MEAYFGFSCLRCSGKAFTAKTPGLPSSLKIFNLGDFGAFGVLAV